MKVNQKIDQPLRIQLPARYANLADLGEERTTSHVIFTLGVDVIRCQENLIQSLKEGTVDEHGNIEADYLFHARQLIRAIFAYIEALTFSVKTNAMLQCVKKGVEISPAERYLSIDTGYEISEKGEVVPRDAHIRLAPNIRFAISLYERAFGLTSEFDPSSEWWSCLRQAIRIRDRLTHPKVPHDVDVSEEELVITQKAKAGFENLIYRYLELAGQLPEALKRSRKNSELLAYKNSGRRWTKGDMKQLRALAKENTPAWLIALKLGRTEGAVRTKAASMHVVVPDT